jgi:hypothetical protein
MKIRIAYHILFVALILGCEDIYSPNIDEVENVIVADARIVNGRTDNYVHLYKSLGFNEKGFDYPDVSGASIALIDSEGGEYPLMEIGEGISSVDCTLDPEMEYKLRIEYMDNIFESDFEPVPNVPDLDTVYGFPEVKIIQTGGENDVNDFREKEGFQLYTDITTESELPYYRFTARKVLQYIYIENMGSEFLDEIYHYKWKSSFPQGTFNIAAPPEYANTNDIIKHPLFFMEESVYMEEANFYAGWILILYQYGLSKSAYNYYNDLNKQLESEGRIFDPLYVQARNNLKCTSDPEEIILGNFEISTVTEHRYFIKFISDEQGYKLKPISNRIDIPLSGETIDEYPEFWEH